MKIVSLEESLKGIRQKNILLKDFGEIQKYLGNSDKKYFLKIGDKNNVKRESDAINL